MAIAFDLDGTLYDTLQTCLDGENYARKIMKLPDLTTEELRSKLQTSDWKAFYMSIGVKEEDVEDYDKLFFEHYNQQIPTIIAGAKQMLERVEELMGYETVYIITNASRESVTKRFEKDGLIHYMDRVHTPVEGKAKEIQTLAERHGSIIYVGDLVSDGEACKAAIENGANVRFFAMLHEYSMNPPDRLKEYVQKHEWATGINTFTELLERVKCDS